MVNIPRNSLEKNNEWSYTRDAYIVGDSLSVGITQGINVAKNAVKWGRQTKWMLEQVQKDISTLKQKKVMFLLGGTNDIFSNYKAERIIANIDKIAQIAKQNGVQVVVGTIPPFSDSASAVKTALSKLNTNSAERSAELEKVNDHIRANYTYIDYHALLRDPKNPRQFDNKWMGKGKANDGIHPFNGYKMMLDEQKKMLEQLSVGKVAPKATESKEDSLTKTSNKDIEVKNENNSPASYISGIISEVEKSLSSFQKQLSAVFSGDKEMSVDQKEKAQKIINQKKEIILEAKSILQKIEKLWSDLSSKTSELNSANIAAQILPETQEIEKRMSDLQKIILELDEAQAILLKEVGLLVKGIKINEFLDKKIIDEMQKVTETDFLRHSQSDRLKRVTIGNIDSAKILSGEVKELEINFAFNGRFNRQLYLGTTAGMILPNEVRAVKSGNVEYFRNKNALQGEFFSAEWKRLTILDEKKLQITNIMTKDELNKQYASKLDLSKFKDDNEKFLALESEKRGISPEIFLSAFGDELKQLESSADKKAVVEELFVEIDRQKWHFFNKHKQSAMLSDGRVSAEFLAYLFSDSGDKYKKVAKNQGYSEEEIKEAGKKAGKSRPDYDGEVKAETIATKDINVKEVERLRKLKVFKPNSEDAIKLFIIAATKAGLPVEWATNKNLHYILNKESLGGKVGVLNYTIRGMSLEEFYKKANASKAKNPIGSRSTASGLGQLLLENVDRYYPSGRKGIGDPIEEAIGFMKYIHDRYGSPDVARSVYGKTGTYVHAVTGKKSKKTFKEGY